MLCDKVNIQGVERVSLLAAKPLGVVNGVPAKFHGIKIFSASNLACDNYNCIGIGPNIVLKEPS